MGQHHSRKASTRDLTLFEVAEWSDDKARTFIENIVGPNGQQVCPKCGLVDVHYKRRHGRYSCRGVGCSHTFSVTSASPFRGRKLPVRQILRAIVLFVHESQGHSANQLQAKLKVQYKTAFVLQHKIRDALTRSAPQAKLEGTVEIDGAYISGRIRKGRKMKHKRRPPAIPVKYGHRAKIPNRPNPRHPNQRVLAVCRQLGAPGTGAALTAVEIIKREHKHECEAVALKWIKPGATVRTDECTGYGNLKHLGFIHQTVNHSIEFSTDDGISENQAESFFSRFRHMIWEHHRITPHYMIDYAWECAFREDMRRHTLRETTELLIRRVFCAGPSADWTGYWQGNHRRVEKMLDPASQNPVRDAYTASDPPERE
ncbi:MAG: IS1595 family transposase [Gammaproteobacteria bacterium]